MALLCPAVSDFLNFNPQPHQAEVLVGKPRRDQESNRPYAANPCNHSNEAKSLSLHKRKIKSSTGVDWKEIHQEMDKVNHVELRLMLTYSGLPWRSSVLTASCICLGTEMHAELQQLPWISAELYVCRLQGKHHLSPAASLLNTTDGNTRLWILT